MQDEVNQDYSEQNEVDIMKKGRTDRQTDGRSAQHLTRPPRDDRIKKEDMLLQDV